MGINWKKRRERKILIINSQDNQKYFGDNKIQIITMSKNRIKIGQISCSLRMGMTRIFFCSVSKWKKNYNSRVNLLTKTFDYLITQLTALKKIV